MFPTSCSTSLSPDSRPCGLRLAALLAASLLVCACGFQLRGEARLPEVMSETHLAVADRSTVFVRELGLMLEGSGVRLVEEPTGQSALLRIHSQRMQRQALSVSGQARVREYLIVFEVDIELVDAGGEPLIERETLRLTRDYSFDEQEILAATREEEFLRNDLSRNMAAQLLRRLEAIRGSGS